ncbi:MAG: hypothetical protein LBG88_03250 [Christensenellaceae bacterium]|jgi:hypothetical protein|nr:hypothetical protein [Christensenellaceae bacterium]
MNDIHGHSIFSAKNYQKRLFENGAGDENSAFFNHVVNDTQSFVASLFMEMRSRHTLYEGETRIMTEIPLPADIKLQPVSVYGQIKDWLICNDNKNIKVSQALLAHCFGPSFHFDISSRNIMQKDGTITTMPIMTVTGSSYKFATNYERFANHANGYTEYQCPDKEYPSPQMQYPHPAIEIEKKNRLTKFMSKLNNMKLNYQHH